MKTTKEPRFFFSRSHKGTEHDQIQLGLFGMCFKWMKWNEPYKRPVYWRGANFGKIAWYYRSVEFTLPRLKQQA